MQITDQAIHTFISVFTTLAYAGHGLLEAHEENANIAQANTIVRKVFIS